MKLEDRLGKDTIEKLNKIRKKKRRKKEKLTERDYRELMGEFRDTYKRGPTGAIRRK